MTLPITSREHQIFSGLSLVSAVVAFFFIARVIEPISFLAVAHNPNLFYFAFFVLAVGTFSATCFFAENFSFSSIVSIFSKSALIFLPTEIIFILGLSSSESFPKSLIIAVGWYIALFGILLVIQRHLRLPDNPDSLTSRQWFHYQIPIHLFFLTLVVGLFLFLGLWKVGHFSAVDEPLWTFDRIPKFWTSVNNLIWDKTRISDKPGITVAYLSGIGLLSVNPLEYKSQYWNEPSWREHYDITDMNAAFRAPIVIAAGLLLLVFFLLIERLAGRTKGILATILIATSPLLLGISRIINPDALLWAFVPLSLFSYLTYKKNRVVHFLYLAGIFLGLSLLTKYVANILFVFFFGLIFLEYLFRSKKERSLESTQDFFRRAGTDFLILIFLAIVTVYMLYPVLWVEPRRLLRATLLSDAFVKVWPLFVGLITVLTADFFFLKSRFIGSILDFLTRFKLIIVRSIVLFFLGCVFFVLYNTWTNMSIIDFPAIIGSPKSAFSQFGFVAVFLANFYPLLFGVTPIVLLFALLGIARLLFRKMTRMTDRVIFISILFILFYYLGTTVNKVAAISRYQIILYPIMAIVAGLSIGNALRMLKENVLAFGDSTRFRSVMVGVVFIISVGSILFVRPFYLSYSSALLQEPYFIDLKDMGAGSFEASEYLNSLPNTENVSVWTDKKGVCANVIGYCYSNFDFKKLSTKHFDYVVVTAGREKRTTSFIGKRIAPEVIHFEKYYLKSEDEAVFSIHLGDRKANYVRIFRFEN